MKSENAAQPMPDNTAKLMPDNTAKLMPRNTNKLSMLLPLLMAAALACSSEEDSNDEEAEDPGEHACEAVGEPGTAVDAAATREDAPLLEPHDSPFTVTLPEAEVGYKGYVTLGGPADLLLFVDSEAVATGLYEGDSSEDLLPSPAPNEDCPEALPEHFDLELEEGGYILELGPSSTSVVWLAITSAAGHAH